MVNLKISCLIEIRRSSACFQKIFTFFRFQDEICVIDEIPWRNVSCTDVPGVQKCLSTLEEMINSTNATVTWNEETLSPYFNYKVINYFNSKVNFEKF